MRLSSWAVRMSCHMLCPAGPSMLSVVRLHQRPAPRLCLWSNAAFLVLCHFAHLRCHTEMSIPWLDVLWTEDPVSEPCAWGRECGGGALAGGGLCDHASRKIQHRFRYAFVHKQRHHVPAWHRGDRLQAGKAGAPMLLGAQGPWGSAGPCECPATPCHPQAPQDLVCLSRL